MLEPTRSPRSETCSTSENPSAADGRASARLSARQAAGALLYRALNSRPAVVLPIEISCTNVANIGTSARYPWVLVCRHSTTPRGLARHLRGGITVSRRVRVR